jgi:hypothetical protein
VFWGAATVPQVRLRWSESSTRNEALHCQRALIVKRGMFVSEISERLVSNASFLIPVQPCLRYRNLAAQ